MATETRETILEATGRALSAHGYADLTVGDIAEESAVTTAAIHYHFDTKEALLNAFLDRLIEGFEAKLATDEAGPRDRLEQFLEAVFRPPAEDDGEFTVALMELKAQAPYTDGYRERFSRLDDRMHAEVRTAVREGVEAGFFADCDPETVARGVVTLINGGHVRGVALGEEPAETRVVVEEYLERRLEWRPEGAT